MEKVVPYSDSQATKKEQVALMFDNISSKYDFLNRFLSLGVDKYWRRKVVKILKSLKPDNVLDIATGTGDLAISIAKIKPKKIVGVDISKGMLSLGVKKVQRKGLDNIIDLKYGDSENLPFETESFSAVTVAFGVRNFENLEKGISEIFRVLKREGKVIILEFSNSNSSIMRKLFNFYFKKILPKVGKIVSKDKSAYTYLPDSVESFPSGKVFAEVLEKQGFKLITWQSFTFGVSTIYVGSKP